MRRPQIFISVCLSLIITLVSFGNALAQSPSPYTPAEPPRQPAGQTPPAVLADFADPTGTKLVSLRAVLVVGPIDGVTGTWTQTEINNMKLAETELISHGVSVSTFYTPNDSWNAIQAAASGAQFFFYRGHGISDGNNPPQVGGLWLSGGYVSPDAIKAGLHLAKNAIVMMYGCYVAGSSSEDVTLSSSEAYRRVVQYSDPFMSIGAAGYFANWFGDAFQYFTRYLFEGRTLGNAFKAYYDYSAASTEIFTRPNDASKVVWLDKDYWDGGYKYDNAFTGLADKSLWDLFNTTMSATVPQVTRLATPASSIQITPITVTGTTGLVFNWTAALSLVAPVTSLNASSTSGGWVALSTSTGKTGDQVTVTLYPSHLPAGTYSATLHLHSDTLGVNQPDQNIPILLRVADSWPTIYIPLAIH